MTLPKAERPNRAVFFTAAESAEMMATYALLPLNYCRHCGERLDLEPHVICSKSKTYRRIEAVAGEPE